MPVALYVLTLAAFAIGTTEFVIMGLLPDVADSLHVGIPQAGLLVTAYALGVVFGGPLLALATAKLPKRATLLGLFALFIIGNLACALAPSYGFLMMARMVTAWSHGTFLGVAGVVANHLVPANKQARANGLIFSGITLANVLGVPGGIAIGHIWGWRATFYAVAAVALGATLALARLLPYMPRPAQGRMLDEFVVFKDSRVVASLALSVTSSASLLCLLTYITPYMTEVCGAAPDTVTWVLLIFGVGLTVGTLLGGHFGDRNLMGATCTGLGMAAVMLLLLPVAAPRMVATVAVLFFWGMFAFGICPLLHTLVMRNAAIAPTLASTLNHSAFNLGNACGAWLGSVALQRGQPVGQLPYTCAGLAMAALGIAVVCIRLERRRTQRLLAVSLQPPLNSPYLPGPADSADSADPAASATEEARDGDVEAESLLAAPKASPGA